MSQELNSLTPARQMSGRRSKPSMDLLVDNQRILSQYVVYKKEPRLSTPKPHLDNTSISNHSEKSSISLKKKKKPKIQRNKIIVKNKEENISPKIVSNKRKIMSPIVNGSKSAIEYENNGSDHHEVLSRTSYATLKLKKIDVYNNTKVTAVENGTMKEDDDLPLSKVFPDFKPRVVETAPVPEKRTILVLPPKKKIKFVNINELNGAVSKKDVSLTTKIMAVGTEITTKKITSPIKSSDGITVVIKTDIVALPKIRKKSAVVAGAVVRVINGAGASNTETLDTEEVLKEKDQLVVVPHTNHTSVVKSSHEVPSPETHTPPPPSVTPRRCVRHTCTNVAIDDSRWDREFCSPDCAVMHTKNIFGDWLIQRRECCDIRI